MRYLRKKIMGDKTSPQLYYLKPVPGHSRIITLEEAASEIETIGALSAEDVLHVIKSFIRQTKTILVRGDKFKIDGLGTFYVTFNTEGTADEKECTVRNIRRVNIRFNVDNTLRLVNDSNATTRGGANNVEFYIKSDAEKTNPSDKPSGGGGNGNNNGNFVDPNA